MLMTKHIHFLTMAVLLMTGCIQGMDQKQEQTGRKVLFDYNWKFLLGDYPAVSTDGYNDDNWRNLDLPHDWSIEGKLDPNNSTGTGGGYLPAGIGWYRKKFDAPSAWRGKRVSIYFEGVYMNSEVL